MNGAGTAASSPPSSYLRTVAQPKQPVVVFVPGFLGSSLWCEEGSSGGTGQWDEIWGEDALSSAQLLRRSVRKLSASEVEARHVIRRFVLGRIEIHDVYGSLLDFCTRPGGLGIPRGGFHEFPYDWRASIAETAEKLEAFVLAIDRTGTRPLRFVAHSLGGLVVRLLLVRSAALASRTDLLFQIATPVGGTQKAYDILRSRLRFESPLDWLVHPMMSRSAAADLREVVLSFQSLYELLPQGEATLLDITEGLPRSPLESRYWPQACHCYLEAAKAVHAVLTQPVNCGRTVRVYSDSHATICMHRVDGTGRIVAREVFRVGDTTVTRSSACAGAVLCDVALPQKGRCTKHTELCRNPVVWQLMRAHLS